MRAAGRAKLEPFYRLWREYRHKVRPVGRKNLITGVCIKPRMAMGKSVPFRRIEHTRPGTRKLLKSYCPVCGMFIAASESLKAIEMAEEVHSCQRSLAFRKPGKSRT